MKEKKINIRRYERYESYKKEVRLLDELIPVIDQNSNLDKEMPKTGRKIVFGGCGEIDCPYCNRR